MAWRERARVWKERAGRGARYVWSKAKGGYVRARERFSEYMRRRRAPKCIPGSNFRLKTKKGNRCACVATVRGGGRTVLFQSGGRCKRGAKVKTWKQAVRG